MIVQAVGGIIASGANTEEESDVGTHTMVGGMVTNNPQALVTPFTPIVRKLTYHSGIVFQLATMTLFCFFFIRFLWNCRRASAIPQKVLIVTGATVISLIMIYIRRYVVVMVVVIDDVVLISFFIVFTVLLSC